MTNPAHFRYCNSKTYNYSEYFVPIPIYLYVFLNAPHADDICHYIFAACYILHYVKRLYENEFVHIYSPEYKPVKQLFINSAYYHLFSLWIAHSVNHSDKECPSSVALSIYILMWLLCEYGNLSIHRAQRRMKEENKGKSFLPSLTQTFP